MDEQGAILFFNEQERAWELVAMDADEFHMSWEAGANALREPASDGWKIEGPFRMCMTVAGLPKVWFIGYGLSRPIH